MIYLSFTLNSPIPVCFSSLIPKMLMFTLAISCLIISNVNWFMDLKFQVTMQYCSLYHWTLLPVPDLSTTEHHSCFNPTVSFFLELNNCPLLFPRSTLVLSLRILESSKLPAGVCLETPDSTCWSYTHTHTHICTHPHICTPPNTHTPHHQR